MGKKVPCASREALPHRSRETWTSTWIDTNHALHHLSCEFNLFLTGYTLQHLFENCTIVSGRYQASSRPDPKTSP